MAPKRKNDSSGGSGGGGLKGFFTRAGKSFYSGGLFVKDQSVWIAQKMLKIGFVVATTSFVTFMPLIFEITREGQMIESEKIQVRELRNEGYSDRQLAEMGFCQASILRAPVVALKK